MNPTQQREGNHMSTATYNTPNDMGGEKVKKKYLLTPFSMIRFPHREEGRNLLKREK